MTRSGFDPSRCDTAAARCGWLVHRGEARERIFAKPGRVFVAAFGGTPHREATHARLRGAGMSVYVVESADEWAAVLAFENRLAEHEHRCATSRLPSGNPSISRP